MFNMELLVFCLKNEVEMCEVRNHHMMKRGERGERSTRNSHTDSIILLSSFDESKDIWKDDVMLVFQMCFEETRRNATKHRLQFFFYLVGTIFGIQK